MGGAAPVIVEVAAVVVAVVAPEVAPAIGTFLTTGDAVAAGAVLEGSIPLDMVATESVVAGNAAIGAATGAAQAAASDKSVAKGALQGAEGGAATGAISAGVDQLGLPKAVADTTKGAASGFTRAELAGSNLQQATRGAELGGATAALTDLTMGAADIPSQDRPLLSSAIGTALNYSNLFGAPSKSSSQTGSAPQGSTTLTGQSGSPTAAGSTVLGSALGVSSDPGSPVQTTEGGTSRSNVWNQASLRNPDQSGGSNV